MQLGSRPEVTVVVPTYARSHLLGRLVGALEKQTLPLERFDVVIVDNNSPDGASTRLAELAATSSLRLRHLVEHQRGPAATRNTGWRDSEAPLMAFIDDDCVPEPGWLAAGLNALRADDRIGVVQGAVRKPDGAPLGDWTLWRHVNGQTPYFEACNIFYRRAALEEAGGFDEGIGNYGEDASLGWSVIEAGWARRYEDSAVVYHDVEERGIRFHIKTGLLERNVARIAKSHPGFRREAFWRPWAYRRENAAFTVALVGLLLVRRHPLAILLALPYLRLRLPPPDHPRRLRFFLEKALVDAAQFTGMRLGALRHPIAVL